MPIIFIGVPEFLLVSKKAGWKIHSLLTETESVILKIHRLNKVV